MRNKYWITFISSNSSIKHLQRVFASAIRFKHTVYGLRYAYRMEGMREKRVILPSLERPKKLPVVLSKAEVRRLLIAPKLLKHRLVLGLLYGCGLRCFELRKLLLKDIDFDSGLPPLK